MAAIPFRKIPMVHEIAEDPFGDWTRKRCVEITITPEKARELLEHHNGHNRSFTRKVVERLTRELAEGHWVVNGETMIFSTDGQLLDGQHRLQACVNSGIPLTTFVMFGIAPEMFSTIDRGRSRCTADDLSIMGEISTTALSAALSLLYWNEIDEMTPTRISNSATTTQCVEMLEKYPAIRESVRYACGHYRKIRLATRTTAFCHFLFTSKDPDEASKFFADLISGADLSGNDPVLVLRNRLFGTIKSKSKMTTMETMALTIKAWNYRRKGKTITAVRWRHEEGEDFPKAI